MPRRAIRASKASCRLPEEKCLQEMLDCILFLPRQGKGIKNNRAANGYDRRELAQDGAITREEKKGLGGAKLRKG